MNASQLEVFFADPAKKEEYKSGNRPGLWGKYQRGGACPNINDKGTNKPSLPNLVETKFPGTRRWLTMPLWRLLTKAPFETDELKGIYLSLSPEVRDLIVHPSYRPGNIFWRSTTDPRQVLHQLCELGTMDAATAILAMIKEAENTQLQALHQMAVASWYICSKKLACEPIIGSLVEEINGFIDRRYERVGYFLPDSDVVHMGRRDILRAWGEVLGGNQTQDIG